MSIAPNRIDAGVPDGGQFAVGSRREPDVILDGAPAPRTARLDPQAQAALVGAFDAASKWHAEWLSEVRDGPDYTPQEVNAVDREHLAQAQLIDDLNDRLANDPQDLDLSEDDLEQLKGVFSSARSWHQEWKGYVRDSGDYDDGEIAAVDRSHSAQVDLFASLAAPRTGI